MLRFQLDNMIETTHRYLTKHRASLRSLAAEAGNLSTALAGAARECGAEESRGTDRVHHKASLTDIFLDDDKPVLLQASLAALQEL